MPTRLSNLVSINHLQRLLSSFSDLYDVTTAILNLDGEILVAAGWKRACTQFHRKNPTTSARCLESDTELASRLGDGEEYNVYCCKNGLVDVAVPIKVGGEHIANLFTGQFFFQRPDKKFFSEQAKAVGFDEELYLKAIDEVPTLSQEQVKKIMKFLRELAELVGELGLANQLLEEKSAVIKHQALYDALTGLPNRTLLMDRIQDEIARSERANSTFAVMFLDLDNFKPVNDKVGHEAGDLVLIEAAKRIKSAIRKYDIVARFGGDEFIIVASKIDGQQIAGRIAQDILSALNIPFQAKGETFSLGASIGIALYPEHEKDPAELLRLADEAMYRCKHAGKGNYEFVSKVEMEQSKVI